VATPSALASTGEWKGMIVKAPGSMNCASNVESKAILSVVASTDL
jgi:hypothetical protein